jgi:hypothetical protein
MKLRTALLAALAVAASLPAVAISSQPKEKSPGLLLIETESRVEVDSEGKVVSVSTTPEMPAEVLAVVEGKLREMRFAPTLLDGRAVGGVTYVQQDACAAPENGAYRFAVKYRGNGPALVQRYAPSYPRDAMRAGAESNWKVTYEIGPDGKATLVEAVKGPGGRGRQDSLFLASIKGWVGALNFHPELVDGKPVRTRVSDNVEYVLSSKSGSALRAEAERERLANSDACKLALAERDAAPRAVALNSPFQPLPVAAN